MSSFIARDIKNLKKFLLKSKNKSSCLVPTMGSLHKGHLSLVKKAKLSARVTIVTIFVNPTQFNNKQDLKNYPRTESEDIKLLKSLKVDCIFIPQLEDIFPKDFNTFVSVNKYKTILCAKNRKNHFQGVATVVAKLFNIIKPESAIFGEKDLQQLLIIKKMSKDLNFNINILSEITIRDARGLAISSRNKNLTSAQYLKAQKINEIINLNLGAIASDSKKLIAKMKRDFKRAGIKKLEYLEIREEENLKKVKFLDQNILKSKVRVFVALKLGNTRLIDNRLINF